MQSQWQNWVWFLDISWFRTSDFRHPLCSRNFNWNGKSTFFVALLHKLLAKKTFVTIFLSHTLFKMSAHWNLWSQMLCACPLAYSRANIWAFASIIHWQIVNFPKIVGSREECWWSDQGDWRSDWRQRSRRWRSQWTGESGTNTLNIQHLERVIH